MWCVFDKVKSVRYLAKHIILGMSDACDVRTASACHICALRVVCRCDDS